MSKLLKPSVFILWSEESLRKSIRNALKFMINFFAPTNVNFNRINKNFDEYYLLFDLILQWSYLYRYQSSFTEYYFKLKRNHPDTLRSLLQICFLPYLKEKLENYYQNLYELSLINDNGDKNNDSKFQKQNQLILQYYPLVKKFFQLSQIILWLSHAVNIDYNHPHQLSFMLLWPSFRMKLMQTTVANNDEISLRNENLLFKISFIMTKFFQFTFHSSAFIIQFLDYWNTREDLRRVFSERKFHNYFSNTLKPIQSNNVQMKSNQCPICGEQRRNETALISSGYIFCYVCIHKYLSANHKCPITGFPSEIEQLIRIF